MNVCLQEKLCENKKDDLSTTKKNCKDNLRTLFVEIPSYKAALDRACVLPNLTSTPANQLLNPPTPHSIFTLFSSISPLPPSACIHTPQ